MSKMFESFYFKYLGFYLSNSIQSIKNFKRKIKIKIDLK